MHANTFVSVLGLVASASAHVKMKEPKGWPVDDNGPLKPDGSDFPCKGVAYDSSVEANTMNKGEKQEMSFIGSAVHGGGSCQVSLTTDTEPTKDSVWKVIKSFEGGCPATSQEENYPENADMELPDKYGFEIPDDVPAGKYTLAWTWFNKVGNREMYMNCAPIEASGDGGSESDFQALPDMFTANIYGDGDQDCRTDEGGDLQFPNPGEFLEKLGSGELLTFNAEQSGCPQGGQYSEGSSGGSEGGSSSGGSASPSESGAAESGASESGAAESSAPAESAPTESGSSDAAPSGAIGGGVFAPIDGSSGAEPTEAPSATEEASAGESTAPAESAPAESAPAESAPAYDEGSGLPSQVAPANGQQEGGSSTPEISAGGEGGHEAGEECTSDGIWNCIGGSSFQRCASGVWSAVQQLSEGTECSPGEAENIQMVRKRGTTRFGAKFFL